MGAREFLQDEYSNCRQVPNRHNYILWLKDLLDTSSSSYSDTYDPDRKVTGLDIGTGASAIYPLLGCVQRPWSFIATDIDSKSLMYARKNVELNNLGSRIRIVERPVQDALIPLDELGIDRIDFVMTNPPFYSSESELLELAGQKSQPPSSACTGAPNEMVCDGGEIGFIRRIIDESLSLKDRVQWYTAMLGKHSSLEVVVELLKEHDIDNYAVAKFIQGNKTRRWAIGWSLDNRRPSVKASRALETDADKKLLPPLAEFTVASKSTRKGGAEQLENIFWTQLEDVTDGLDLVSWELDEDRLRVVGFADQNVWSRAYRRSKTKHFPSGRTLEQGIATKRALECAFGFSISIQTQKAIGDGLEDTVGVVVRWLQGTDYSMFESFFGMLRTALLSVIK
jgi:23S rRNA (adenine1618-N6)-methyltransferase